MPFKDYSLFPLPEFRTFNTTYSELCNHRAIEILKNAETLGTTIYVLYSGGIDSTCVLVSLLTHATPAQRKNIVVLLSHESIAENPRFYADYIRGKLRVESSIMFPNLLGGKDMLVSGEHNDMVMGSDKIGQMMTRYGAVTAHAPYNRDLLTSYFSDSLGGDLETASFYIQLFERVCAAAPVPIRSNLDFLWWTNFAIKWQACYAYILLLTPPRNASGMTKDYLDSRFVSFFNTEEFQLWSMNNQDKRLKDTWKTYKWVVKDVIYEFNKDVEYRDNKTKKGSLTPLTGRLFHNKFIDERLHLCSELAPASFLEAENDFT